MELVVNVSALGSMFKVIQLLTLKMVVEAVFLYAKNVGKACFQMRDSHTIKSYITDGPLMAIH
jgi:hypothetical protein